MLRQNALIDDSKNGLLQDVSSRSDLLFLARNKWEQGGRTYDEPHWRLALCNKGCVTDPAHLCSLFLNMYATVYCKFIGPCVAPGQSWNQTDLPLCTHIVKHCTKGFKRPDYSPAITSMKCLCACVVVARLKLFHYTFRFTTDTQLCIYPHEARISAAVMWLHEVFSTSLLQPVTHL